MISTVSVPIPVPSQERLEEIFREECARVAKERATWFDFKSAAEYLRISLRTFERRKKKWGLPVSEFSSGLKIVYRADLDALALNHLVEGRNKVVHFPSVAARDELRPGPTEKRGVA
jgi:hypothetical protein